MKPHTDDFSRLSSLLAIATPTFASLGCASIMNGGSRSISMRSVPAGATISVFKEDGEQVHSGTTPLIVPLSPGKGYFRGQAYTVRFEMNGYRPAELIIRPEVSGWYFGNIIFGGLLGLLIIDPATGSMWNLAPEKLEHTMTPLQASSINEHNGFMIALLSDVAESDRVAMTRIK
jgi:hypothetical protein